jgi:hypothetical protein
MIIRVIEDRGQQDYIKDFLKDHTVEFGEDLSGIWDVAIVVMGNRVDPDVVALIDFDLRERVIFAAASWTSGMRSLAGTYAISRLIKYPFNEKLVPHLIEIDETRRIY